MTNAEFLLGLLALLLVPGPTNTLLALAGAERGMWPSLRLTGVVACAYGVTVLPLALAGHAVLADHAALRHGVTLAAAAWVAWLAVKLWRGAPGPSGPARDTGPAQLFITTLLNPKALIAGLVLLPGQPSIVVAGAAFFALLGLCSTVWIAAGAMAGAGGTSRIPLLRKASAAWLALLAAWLGHAALAA